jgi:hypothetical protein
MRGFFFSDGIMRLYLNIVELGRRRISGAFRRLAAAIG